MTRSRQSFLISSLLTASRNSDVLTAKPPTRKLKKDIRVLVIKTIPKPRGINHRQADPDAFLFQLDIVALDLDRLLLPRRLGVLPECRRVDGRVRVFGVGEDLVRPVRDEGLFNEGVDERCAACARGAYMLAVR